KQRAFRRHKAPLAIAAIVMVMGVAAFNVLSITALALIAAIFVVLTGCLDMQEAREAIVWRILFIIFGMLALGTAIETTGAAHLIARGVTGLVGRFGPWGILSVVYLVATLLTELISKNVVAVLLIPSACGIAAAVGCGPPRYALAA